ncbi:hypothetical protein CHUAL_006284 [Chamberlinius hualienensis]
MAGKTIQTVLGPVHPSDLGITLTHEHLSMQLDHLYYQGPPPHAPHMTECPITSQNREWMLQNVLHHRNNIVMNDVDAEAAIVYDVNQFKSAGGGAIVDCSTLGLHRRDAFLKTLAIETGVKIIAGGGFYFGCTQAEWLANYSVEQLAETIKKQLVAPLDGKDTTRCGFIGEVGVSWPIHEFEKRSIAASAVVNAETGCPVLIHPPHSLDGKLEVVRIFEEFGGNASKLVIAHLDWPSSHEESLSFAAGCPKAYLALDSFGHDWSIPGFPPAPQDKQRVELINQLIKDGHENRIMLSHDLFAKIKLEKYGGHGYSHLVKFGSTLMKEFGIAEELINKFFIKNPKNWLAY